MYVVHNYNYVFNQRRAERYFDFTTTIRKAKLRPGSNYLNHSRYRNDMCLLTEAINNSC